MYGPSVFSTSVVSRFRSVGIIFRFCLARIVLGAPSISSPNGVDLFGDYANQIDSQYLNENNNLIYTNSSFKGYALLSLKKENAKVVYKYVSTVKSKDYKNLESRTFDIKHNQPIKIKS